MINSLLIKIKFIKSNLFKIKFQIPIQSDTYRFITAK